VARRATPPSPAATSAGGQQQKAGFARAERRCGPTCGRLLQRSRGIALVRGRAEAEQRRRKAGMEVPSSSPSLARLLCSLPVGSFLPRACPQLWPSVANLQQEAGARGHDIYSRTQTTVEEAQQAHRLLWRQPKGPRSNNHRSGGFAAARPAGLASAQALPLSHRALSARVAHLLSPVRHRMLLWLRNSARRASVPVIASQRRRRFSSPSSGPVSSVGLQGHPPSNRGHGIDD
jgi:hypothetical protein